MKITKDIIDRYLQRSCTAEEAAQLEKYIQQSGKSLDQLLPQDEWNLTYENLDYDNQEELKVKVFALIEQNRKSILKRKGMWAISKAAAILIVGIGCYIVLNPFKKTPISQEIKKDPIETVQVAVSNLYYINSGNENMVLMASDGSVITLYPKSEIKYPEDFSGLKERKLYLKGKAKFEVAKNKEKPFRVHSTGVTTTALGTVFIVDERRSTQTQIKLLEGRIEVEAENPQRNKKLVRTFLPNEEITLDHHDMKVLEEKKVHTVGVDRGGYFLQNEMTIQFKNIAVADVLSLLTQNNDIQLQYDVNKIKNKFYSGTFSNSVKVYEDIIKEINYLHHADITYTNFVK